MKKHSISAWILSLALSLLIGCPAPVDNGGGNGGSLSDNNRLSSLNLTDSDSGAGVTLSPSFSPEVMEYTATVPNSTVNLNVAFATQDSGAQGSVVGNTNLAIGLNTVRVVVAAANFTARHYVVQVTRAAEVTDEAQLTNLTVSYGSLSPAFSPDQLAYTLSVPNSVTSLTLGGSASVLGAAISGLGTQSLEYGDNEFEVVVTALDGTTTRTYTLTVNRAPSDPDNASLADLDLGAGLELNQPFNPEVLTYSVDVPNGLSSLDLSAFPADQGSTLVVTGADNLSVGVNTVTLAVTSSNGQTTVYTLTVNRAASISTETRLLSLSLSAGSLNPLFNPETLAYTVTVPNAVDSVTFQAQTWDSGAVVSGLTPLTLSAGSATERRLTVTAADGVSQRTYVVVVLRQAADGSSALLSSFGLSGVTISPSFTLTTYSYTASVPNSVSSFVVSPVAADAGATAVLTVNGQASDGQINLPAGANTLISVTVTSADGTQTRTYSLTVWRAPSLSTNTNLASLSVTGFALSPSFSANVLAYSVTVPSSTTSVTVTAQAADSNATVGGARSHNLDNAETTIPVIVTSQSGATKTYTVTVRRQASISTNADLAALSVLDYTLSPSFNKDVLSYTLSVPNSAANVVVSATKSDVGATLTGTGSRPLNVGQNSLSVVVTAADGTTTKTYTIVVTRADFISNNADLSALTVSTGTLSPVFNAATLNYTVSVPNAVSSLTLGATTADAGASAAGTGLKSNLSVAPAVNSFAITVTAANGTTTKTYTVNVTRAAPVSNNANLSSLSVAGAPLSPSFSAATTAYSVTVPNTTTSVTIDAAAAEATGGVVGAGVKNNLVEGANVFNLTVTAPDGSTTKVYTLTVYRQPLSTGSVSVNITDLLQGITVTLSSTKGSWPLGQNAVFTANVSVAVASYEWYVNGTKVAGASSSSLSTGSQLSIGVHKVQVLAESTDGRLAEASLNVTVFDPATDGDVGLSITNPGLGPLSIGLEVQTGADSGFQRFSAPTTLGLDSYEWYLQGPSTPMTLVKTTTGAVADIALQGAGQHRLQVIGKLGGRLGQSQIYTWNVSANPDPDPQPEPSDFPFPYEVNAQGKGGFKTITVDGANTAGEWTDALRIAVDAANDDPRSLGSNWTMHEAPIDFTHLWAAWDNDNLYLAWQMVDVTDVTDPSNAGSGDPISRNDGILLWVALDTVPGAGATKDMWNKGITWAGTTKPDHQLYMAGSLWQGYASRAVNNVFALDDGGINYKTFAGAGIQAAKSNVLVPSAVFGPKDVDDLLAATIDPAKIKDFVAVGFDGNKHTNTTRDSFYEIKIPLSWLGLTRAQLEANGLGVMIGAGSASALDTIPHDAATLDTPGVETWNSTKEWSDADALTAPFARVAN